MVDKKTEEAFQEHDKSFLSISPKDHPLNDIVQTASMNDFKTSVRDCLAESTPMLFSLIDEVQEKFQRPIFELIISERSRHMPQESFGNVEDMLISPLYAEALQTPLMECDGKTDIPTLVSLHKIEQTAYRLYGNIGRAWAEYELYKNTKESASCDHNQSPEWQQDDTEIIPDISKDKRQVKTLGLPEPCLVPNAVKDNFIRLVLQEKWWEALSLLFLSKQGKHVLYYDTQESKQFPQLLATALIQDFPETGGEDRLLTRSPFFRTENWKPLLGGKQLQKEIETYIQQNTDISFPSIKYHLVPQHAQTIQDLEEGIIQAIGRDHITEWIRLTSEGKTDKEKLINLYYGTGKMGKIQANNGVPFSFGITDTNMTVVIFDLLEGLTDRKCYLLYSEHKIRGNNSVSTSKIILLNANIAKAIEQIDIRRIVKGLILLRKHGMQDVITTLREGQK